MQPLPQNAARGRILAPRAPVLVMDGRRFVALTDDGELAPASEDGARRMIAAEMPVVCHAPRIAAQLRIGRFAAYDVLELFAFVHPGRFCVPTPRGLARALHLLEPACAEDECLLLKDAARHLLSDLAAEEGQPDPAAVAAMMGLTTATGAAGWPWTPAVLAARGREADPPDRREIRAALRLWDRLPAWAAHAPAPPPGHHGVSGAEAQERLRKLLALQEKEDRPQQAAYAAAVAGAFAPCDAEGQAHVVLAEAGTGTGKTLGYLAPATVWAEKNGGTVWISTYTRNLQRQLDTELARLYADPAERARRAVTRKGRENYLCLLNLEDEAQSPGIESDESSAAALGLVLRWAGATRDGDMTGPDFPGWLPGLLGPGRAARFADRRGECVYAACPHFDKCFVEKSVRRARRADIVIANHALVMHQTAAGAEENPPARYVFDEGHHLFEAADSAFCAHLNGRETADLRLWLLGAETGPRSRARGIRRRLEDLTEQDETARAALDALVTAARCLPAPLWRQRLRDKAPRGPAEAFLSLCRAQVYARNADTAGPYALETAAAPPVPGLPAAAAALAAALGEIQKPMLALARFLQGRLEDEAGDLDTETRARIQFLISSLTRRTRNVVGAWIEMLGPPQDVPGAETVDWLEVGRGADGQDEDAGLCRYYVDPVRVFAEKLKAQARGVVVTSATLRDATPDDPEGWDGARMQAGLRVLDAGGAPARLFSAPSPFDYAAQTRILVVGDVRKDSPGEVAAAFRALFMAAGGGALGVFTAVQRLRAVRDRIAGPLHEAGIPLYAQHADALDAATLIDMFRAEEDACLLGTDAARDGIDVPGRSLRLVVYDRVPWPRPTILHKARRARFGKGYDDTLTRFRLKQAYGRLVRRADDRGVFVMLDGALPSRLLTAFPQGVEVRRAGLKDAVEAVRDFLGKTGG